VGRRQSYGLAWIITGLMACHPGNGPYYNKEKWKIPGGVYSSGLRSSPKTVREYIYEEPKDTNGLYKKRGLYYLVYGFNREGDMVYRKAYMDDTLIQVSEMSYDSNGLQSRFWMTSVGNHDTFRVVSRSLGGGRFRSISNRPAGGLKIWITTYVHDGQECVEESFPDSAAGKPNQRIHTFYEGQRLLKRDITTPKGMMEERYFYSEEDSPDSILSINTGNVVQRELFKNNKQGDPVAYWKINGADTLMQSSIQYTYDKNGNWIRQREVRHEKPVSYLSIPGTVYITDREIDY
jgi:hypothetical protein